MNYYAVRIGKVPGIYKTWTECETQVKGVSGARYKKFPTLSAAEQFVAGNDSPTSQSAHEDIHRLTISSDSSNRINKIHINGDIPSYLNRSQPNNSIIESSTNITPMTSISDQECLSDNSRRIIAFTDGACSNNGKPTAIASYAVVFPDYPSYNFSSLLPGDKQTNMRAEYTAFITAYDIAKKINPNCKLHIKSDCNTLVNYIHNRLNKDGYFPTQVTGKVENRDLVEKVHNIMSTGNVTIEHVYAHTNNNDYDSIWNNVVDNLARKLVC